MICYQFSNNKEKQERREGVLLILQTSAMMLKQNMYILRNYLNIQKFIRHPLTGGPCVSVTIFHQRSFGAFDDLMKKCDGHTVCFK